ncbi:Rqc2 family fibronectin-binding protein [Clostridium sp. Cult2]|uniref:Rqc2 family fibronectin-binding protein n=1 Tax=Clostridium sp. Cult2 TaxID=2079003 RepID=UPI001F441DF8|nr:NFACT RNA binding domain-containing protein [Clostridium sp. Cult2]MCF6466440.1 fibronectin/fibrinogen-binding protein [Clostridium sp. Cult2]
MSLDGIVTRSIVQELDNTILGGRVDKIYQHENDEILMNIYNKGKNRKLLISASSNNPRIHLTNYGKSNPSSPPMFCMLLRKHLSGGIILNIEQFQMDRIIFIDISSKDELGEPTEKRLIVEIMGKYSNIILIDKKSLKIIDSIKRVTSDMSRVRQVLPGIEYNYPQQNNKLNPLELREDQFFQLLDNDNGNKQIYKFFYTNYMGLGPLIGKEICFRSNINIDRPISSLTMEEKSKLFHSFMAIVNRVKENDFKPLLIKNGYEKSYLAFYALDLYQFVENKTYVDSISKVLDQYYIKNDTLDRVYQKSQSLRKSVQIKLDRSLNKLAKQKQELLDSKNRDKYKIYADLISANLYRIGKGLEEVELENFYSENMDKIIVPLDKRYSPAENAQRYYKRYSKLKNANLLLLKQIPETEEEIEYLENVLHSLDNCTEVIEIDEIREELIKEGYLKGNLKKKKKKEAISKPHHYISSDGFHIFVGKNNRQNDNLTLKTAHKEDLWFHVQKMPGSHVIIKVESQVVPETTLEEAAMLAAYYSKGKNSTNVAVDYTEKKNVKKPKNAKAGMVIYENFSTIFVTPKKENIEKIEKIEGF